MYIVLFVFQRTHRDSSNLSGMLDVTLSTHIQNQFMKEFDIHGAIEFKMDERTYRMIPLANSEDYMYRKNSLIKAKEVCFDEVLNCLLYNNYR